MAARDHQQPQSCFVCGRGDAEVDWFVLLQGRATRLHCSSSCLAETVDWQRRRAAARSRRRVMLLLTLVLVAAAFGVVRHYRAPPPQSISGDSPGPLAEPPPPGPVPYGPAWPPTDDEWIDLFTTVSWIYPLPGPTRHPFISDARIYGAAVTDRHPTQCRIVGRCAVDLGGELWGEHVYAAQDGIVDRVQASGHDDHGGQYVRLSHFGGMVFTQYFHLAAVPRGIAHGARVRAGELIGLLGDTGTEDGRKHLYFALSVRPSVTFPEVYWDPSIWMGSWPLRVPPNGSVAGLVPTAKLGDMPRRHR